MKVTDEMIDRFLTWSLPDTFSPDCYISFDKAKASKVDDYGNRSWPVGTNLLTATEARQMLEHVLKDEVAELERENTSLRNAIIDVLDRLEPEESASLEGDSWEPNLAMSVCSTLREAIGERNG